MKRHQRLTLFCAVLFCTIKSIAQTTYPLNDVASPTHHYYAFTNATIVKDANTTLTNATMIIRDGKIVAVGTNLKARMMRY